MMKKPYLLLSMLAVIATPATLWAEDAPADPELTGDRGYFFGYGLGNSLQQTGNEDVDLEALLQGLRDSLAGEAPNLTMERQEAVTNALRLRQTRIQTARQEANNRQSTDNLAAAIAFLDENKQRPGIRTTSTGLQFEIITEGTGPSPNTEDTVRVHYVGTFVDGSPFDSSIKRGEPAEFRLDQVIPGWTEGLQLMRVGGKRRLFIHPDLAYGPGGRPGIPPNSALIFEVELLHVIKSDD